MPRILFWVFIAFLVWFVVRWVTSSRRRDATDAARGATPGATSEAVETMRQCAWCGVHMPAGDTLALADGRAYCSVPHRDAAIRADEAASASRPDRNA